jgi:hypothetical protein
VISLLQTLYGLIGTRNGVEQRIISNATAQQIAMDLMDHFYKGLDMKPNAIVLCKITGDIGLIHSIERSMALVEMPSYTSKDSMYVWIYQDDLEVICLL